MLYTKQIIKLAYNHYTIDSMIIFARFD